MNDMKTREQVLEHFTRPSHRLAINGVYDALDKKPSTDLLLRIRSEQYWNKFPGCGKQFTDKLREIGVVTYGFRHSNVAFKRDRAFYAKINNRIKSIKKSIDCVHKRIDEYEKKYSLHA